MIVLDGIPKYPIVTYGSIDKAGRTSLKTIQIELDNKADYDNMFHSRDYD